MFSRHSKLLESSKLQLTLTSEMQDEQSLFIKYPQIPYALGFNPQMYCNRYWRNTVLSPTLGGIKIQCDRYMENQQVTLIDFSIIILFIVLFIG